MAHGKGYRYKVLFSNDDDGGGGDSKGPAHTSYGA